MNRKLLIVFLLPLISDCASLVKGSDQVVTVDTPNCPGAICRLSNNDGTYFINRTPGTVSINKSGSDLTVSCYKGDEASASMSTGSNVENMAWGNILIGGIIGGGVDMATGAAYNYPNFIEHPLDCRASRTSNSNQGGLKLKTTEDERDEAIKDLQEQVEFQKNVQEQTIEDLKKEIIELKKQQALKPKESEDIRRDSRITTISKTVNQDKQKDILEPKLITKNIVPNYSRNLRSRELEGSVVIQFDITKIGKVKNVSVFKSSGHFELDAIALEAVKQYLYTPTLKDGKPIKIEGKKKKFSFSLE